MTKEELWNQVESIHEATKEKTINLIIKVLNDTYGGFIEFKEAKINEGDNETIFKSLFYDKITQNVNIVTIYKGKEQTDNIYALRLCDIFPIVDFIKYNSISKYKWIASSDDDCFSDSSSTSFKTEEEAYNDMRNEALTKMKWNTEYGDIPQNHDLDEDYIGYGVKFFKDKIIHESYSGIYTYKIVKIG